MTIPLCSCPAGRSGPSIGACELRTGSPCSWSSSPQEPWKGTFGGRSHLRLRALTTSYQGIVTSQIVLAQDQVVAFHIRRVNRPLPAIGSAQTVSPSEDIVWRTKHDASVDVHVSATSTVLRHLGIAQQGMGNANRIARLSWPARGRRPLARSLGY